MRVIPPIISKNSSKHGHSTETFGHLDKVGSRDDPSGRLKNNGNTVGNVTNNTLNSNSIITPLKSPIDFNKGKQME